MEEWKEGIFVPVVKKGREDKISEYRRVTIMPSLCKVYTAVLAEKLREEVKGRKGTNSTESNGL